MVTRGLDLPRGKERELVRVRERTYELNGSESRSLATVGAFRVVRVEDLRDPSDPRDRGLKHLRDQGLVRSVSLGGRTRDVVVLTREGRDTEPADLLDALNSRIDDADFRVGPSYLMKRGVHRDGGLERTWRTKIFPLLEEYHYGEGVDIEKRYGLAALRESSG